MEKIKLSREKYDAAIEKYREQNGYDELSDDEKAAFDEKLDKAIQCSDYENETEPGEASESPSEASSDRDKLREELKSKYGYDDMSNEQKAAFDEKLDKAVGAEDSSEEDTGDNDIRTKVLRLRR